MQTGSPPHELVSFFCLLDKGRALERLPIAKLLCGAGADANAQGASGATALHAAARAGAFPLCEFLIYDAGALPGIKDVNEKTALDYAKLFGRDKATLDLLRRTTPP